MRHSTSPMKSSCLGNGIRSRGTTGDDRLKCQEAGRRQEKLILLKPHDNVPWRHSRRWCSVQVPCWSQTCLPMMPMLYSTLLMSSTSPLWSVFMTFGGERPRLGTGHRPRCRSHGALNISLRKRATTLNGVGPLRSHGS